MRDGSARLVEAPLPIATGPHLLVETRATVISVGTERSVVDFARASWLERARSQPEKIGRVIQKARSEGVTSTLRAVQETLDTPIPLGYCQAGIVREVGSQVVDFRAGDRVVTNGNHADFVRVPHTLAAALPDSVSFEAGAFTPLYAIGLQGLRLSGATLGETVVVYGLGLIGLLTVQLARASGCRVIGIDRDPARCSLAATFGAVSIVAGADVDVVGRVMDLTHAVGADAVLLTLATTADEPIHNAAAMSRKRGRIILVGVTGLQLQRSDFYEKELSFQVSCSYGPGRYDPRHEGEGIDYPLPYVRWTEGRNFAAVLDLMARGAVDPLPLVTHRFDIDDVERAYDTVANGDTALGVVLRYAEPAATGRSRTIALEEPTRRAVSGQGVVGWIGAGNFSARVLIPAFARAGATLDTLASSGGLTAAVIGRRHGFRHASSDGTAVVEDPRFDTIVVATRHSSHASWTTRALARGKHVFVEKPLALTHADVDSVERLALASRSLLCVGFNRRFAPDVLHVARVLRDLGGPRTIVITVNAGAVPRSHWTQDPQVGGGRIVGEACHFIDLARALAAAPIASIQVVVATVESVPADDVVAMQLGFANGSIASIQYVSSGDKSFPKERVEVFAGGRVLQIGDFRGVRGFGAQGTRRALNRRQDKGHDALAAAFIAAVRSGGPAPIPLGELLEVSRVSVDAAALAAAGGGTRSYRDGDGRARE